MEYLRGEEIEDLYSSLYHLCNDEVLPMIDSQDDLITHFKDEAIIGSNRCKGGYSQSSFFAMLQAYYRDEACFTNDVSFTIKNGRLQWERTYRNIKRIEEDIRGCDKRLIFVPVGYLIVDGSGHANALIIDREKETIELFEPNGETYGFFSTIKEDSNVYIERIFKKLIPFLRTYRFIPTLDFCPSKGPQVYAAANHNCDEGGYCVVFSSLYMHLRLLEPDVAKDRVIAKLLDMDPEELLTVIINYLYFIEERIPSSIRGEMLFEKLLLEHDYDVCSVLELVESYREDAMHWE